MANDALIRVAQDSVEVADRRRPGRPEQISPELIPILRGEFDRDLPGGPPGRMRLDWEFATGVAFASLLMLAGLAVRFAAW